MAKEWVDADKLEVAERAYADADKKLNETLAQLIEVEKAHRNA